MIFKRRDIYILIIASLLVLYLSLKDEFSLVLNNILNTQPIWLSMGIICVFIYWLLEAKTMHLMIKEFVPEYKFKDTIKLVLSTQFFNGITPFATGGQPFQIYILTRSGLSISSATSACLQNFIVYQCVLVTFGFATLALQHNILIQTTSIINLKVLIFIGFFVNAFVIVGLFLIAYSARFKKFITFNILNFLHKIRLLKDIELHRKKLSNIITEFHHDAGILKRNPNILIPAIALNILKLIVFYSIAFFISKSLFIDHISLYTAIISTASVMLITSIIPIPGATLGAEFSFLIFFSGYISGHQAKSMMLIWRFITYYIGLVLGALVFASAYKEKSPD